MTAAESKGLKKGSRVYWQGDATDGGIITKMMGNTRDADLRAGHKIAHGGLGKEQIALGIF